jgi:hypothetical protein
MSDPRSDDAPFFPSGAIAFFVTMVVVYVATWFALYALLAARS